MTSTVAEPVTDAALDLKLNLLLARLLVAPKRPPTPAKIREDLARVLGSKPSTEWLQEGIERLRADGLVGEKLDLTDAGRQRALDFLGLDRVPPKANWGTITSRYLVPIALGINPKGGPSAKKLEKAEPLAALLLKRRLCLPANTGESLNNVLEAIVCRELNYPNETTLKGVLARKLEELIRSPKQLTAKQAATQVPVSLLKTGKSGVAALRDLALREWASSQLHPGAQVIPNSPRPAEPLDPDMFARTVLAAARSCPTGWFGDNKVFVNHVYRHLHGESAFRDMTLDDFKQKLVEANRTDRLELSRADLVSVMDSEDVRQSETRQLDAVYHFILVQKERP